MKLPLQVGLLRMGITRSVPQMPLRTLRVPTSVEIVGETVRVEVVQR